MSIDTADIVDGCQRTKTFVIISFYLPLDHSALLQCKQVSPHLNTITDWLICI
jgi:hypothetical protein